MRFFVLTAALIMCGFASQASAQCPGGVCRLPGRPVARIRNAVAALPRAIGTRQQRIQRDGWYAGKNFGRRARQQRGGWYLGKNWRRWRR